MQKKRKLWDKKELKEVEKYFKSTITEMTLYQRIHKLNPDRTFEAIMRQVRKFREKGYEKNKYKALEKLRVGYLDIETTNLNASFGHMLSWFIKKAGKNEYDSAVITKKEIFNYEFDKRITKELLEAFDNIVIVAHSFSGMFVLSDPRIESQIKGLVLLNTSPNAKWMQSILQQAKQYQLPDLSSIQARYQDHPSNTLFKALTMACAPYFFSESDLEFGKAMLETLPYSHASYDWVGQYFHPNYEAKWIPKDTPTLIVGSELDHITPLSLFKNDKRWQKKNIVIECIEDAGHIPWMTSVDKIKVLFDRFITKM